MRSLADEVPFDIPDSWEWVRLGSIGETNIGLTYKPSDVTSDGVPVLRSNNIQNGQMDYSELLYVSCTVPERAYAHKGDILICARNGSRALVGKSAIHLFEKFWNKISQADIALHLSAAVCIGNIITGLVANLSTSDALMGYCLHFHFISKTFAAAFIETSPIKNMRERLAFSEGQCYNG